MFFRLLPVILVLVVFCGPCPARTFTNAEGRTIEAEIVRATETTVTLRLANKRTTTIKIATLSEADQAHITGWLAAKIPSPRFTPNVTRSNKNKRYEGTSLRSSYTQIQTYEMSVDVRNEENTKGLEESVMKYILVGRSLTNEVFAKPAAPLRPGVPAEDKNAPIIVR